MSFILFYFSSCEIINPEEQIPAYIKIDTTQLQTNNSTQGSEAHNITDCWLYVNSELIGVFEPPFSVPVLKDAGTYEIVIQAGIKNNGAASNRIVYPFVSNYTTQIELNPNQETTLSPVFEYHTCEFALIENFEDLGISFEVTEQSDTTIILVDNNNAQEGSSMSFILDDEHDAFECKTTDLYELPRNSPVYLEMSFKCTDAFTFGVFSRKYSGGSIFEERIPVITMTPTDEWKTIYIELTDRIVEEASAYDFRLYYTCIRPESADNEKTEVFIDNIKLIHY